MSSVTSKLSNVPNEEILVIRMENVFHTPPHHTLFIHICPSTLTADLWVEEARMEWWLYSDGTSSNHSGEGVRPFDLHIPPLPWVSGKATSRTMPAPRRPRIVMPPLTLSPCGISITQPVFQAPMSRLALKRKQNYFMPSVCQDHLLAFTMSFHLSVIMIL